MDWKGCDAPDMPSTAGDYVRIDRLQHDLDGPELFAAIGGPENDALWQYIPFGPFDSGESLIGILAYMEQSHGWQTLVFRGNASGEVLGMASYMRVRPEAGSAEVGGVVFSTALQRTPAATETIYLMARHVFDDLGYRRFEWKCDSENAGSESAARRFGFEAEGVFRQDMVVKGRSRDTAWFSMLDREWPLLRSAFEQWLAPTNFDAAGVQRRRLAEIRRELPRDSTFAPRV
jgi:RimJ/RimL family protein N-acetyltransferase